MPKIVVVAKEIKGKCAASIKPSDKFTIKGPNIVLEESDVICATGLASTYPVLFALKHGLPPEKLGSKKICVQCLDPGPPYNEDPNGGSVIFEVQILEEK